jgi:di/tripeptidase
VVTGVLGPNSNAHGPNEFLHIGAAKKVSASIADILREHARK